MRPIRELKPATRAQSRGIVLPVALIMLVIISFAGLIAARNSATYEQFSNNLRTNQFARQNAEAALHYCERVAIGTVDASATQFPLDAAKIVTTDVASTATTDIQGAAWNTVSNWAASPGTNLITVTLGQSSAVQTAAQTRNNPSCVVQTLAGDRFLITARGLSNDAVVAADGTLSSGAEVWLQSTLTPGTPTVTSAGGVEQPL
jgi:type IV pilus assembly protein PilX